MNYVWELILQADKEKIAQETFRFVNAANPSPYQELSIEILNAHSIREACEVQPRHDGNGNGRKTSWESSLAHGALPVEVNALYRFAKEFGGILDCNVTGLEQTRAAFLDICMHYLARTDLLAGLSRYEYYRWLLEDDIEGRKFGGEIQENYHAFLPEEKELIVSKLYVLCKTGNYLPLFKQAVMELYPKAIIYESMDHANELLVYLGKKETAEEKKRITLIRDMFLPVQETVHIFYDHHFGIIGVDETMVLDEMVLF